MGYPMNKETCIFSWALAPAFIRTTFRLHKIPMNVCANTLPPSLFLPANLFIYEILQWKDI